MGGPAHLIEPPAQLVPEAPVPCPTQRSSLRQANRGTFQRMLTQRMQEDQDYAAYERAAEARMKRGVKRPAPQQATPPAVTPAAAAAAAAGGPDGVAVVKRRRGRPPKPRPPEAPKPPLMGELRASSELSAVGIRVRKPTSLLRQVLMQERV
jgi:hypothetical protein